MLTVGQPLPNVTGQALIPNGEFADVSLIHYWGKWLVLFFYRSAAALAHESFGHRATFIANPEGVIESVTINSSYVGRSPDETLRTLQALKTGELMPCEWIPGQKSLNAA